MTRPNLGAQIKNLSRGGENYRHLRWRVLTALIERPNDRLDPMPEFLATRFFGLRLRDKGGALGQPLHALPLLARDWKVMKRLLQHESGSNLDRNYLRLAADYIIHNHTAVSRLTALESLVSRMIFEMDMNGAANTLLEVDPADRQSLFVFKLYSALHANTQQTIANYFAEQAHSGWVRQRLVYPLIYYFLNLPADRYFEQMLEQFFPDQKKSHIERLAVGLLLRDELGHEATLALKCYVGLLCHPFDMLEILSTHFEKSVAAGRALRPDEIEVITALVSATGSHRLETVLLLSSRSALPFQVSPQSLPLSRNLALANENAAFFEAFVSGRAIAPVEPGEGLYKHLHGLRWKRYPTKEDFEAVSSIERRYSFCEAGRLIGVLMTSLYMVERKPALIELLHIARHVHFFGCVSPFTCCSPRGAVALSSGALTVTGGNVEQAVDSAIAQGEWASDRRWIKSFHWKQRVYEQSMRLSAWFERVREMIPLSGNSRFLSGIDWTWIDEVISAVRIKPFYGNPNAAYVLLIRLMEERQRDSNTLRLAMTPLLSNSLNVAGAVDYLIGEFGADTTAFIRFFLTPQMILKMRLETSYTAALSERLEALEYVVDQFGLNDEVLTLEQFAQEQRALTTALTFLSVAAAQFEVPWDAFSAEAADDAEDMFRAYQALTATYNNLPLLSDAHKSSLHLFTNKQAQPYDYRNRYWPLVLTICNVIDTFLSNPSYGIEAILAIRIRHDNMRREFAVVLSALRKMTLPGVRDAERNLCLPMVEHRVYPALQAWIDRYMHTPRAADSKGLFDFVPNQAEMDKLVGDIAADATLRDVVQSVVKWLQNRLDTSLERARDKLSGELKASFLQAAREAQEELVASQQVTQSVAEIVSTAAADSLLRKADELIDWFQAPRETRRSGLTFGEMKLAADGRFRSEVERGELTSELYSPTLVNAEIEPDAIRAAFDMWSELTTNVLKYRKRPRARLRVWEFRRGPIIGLVFSSLANSTGAEDRFLVAEPNAIASEPMLKSGKSGLMKVASLAAGITRMNICVRVVQRGGGFHVIIPLIDESAP